MGAYQDADGRHRVSKSYFTIDVTQLRDKQVLGAEINLLVDRAGNRSDSTTYRFWVRATQPMVNAPHQVLLGERLSATFTARQGGRHGRPGSHHRRSSDGGMSDMPWFRAVDVTEADLARWDAEDSGQLVQLLREERGLTRSRLARLAGTSHAELARFEMGLTVPAQPMLIRYLQAMGYPED